MGRCLTRISQKGRERLTRQPQQWIQVAMEYRKFRGEGFNKNNFSPVRIAYAVGVACFLQRVDTSTVAREFRELPSRISLFLKMNTLPDEVLAMLEPYQPHDQRLTIADVKTLLDTLSPSSLEEQWVKGAQNILAARSRSALATRAAEQYSFRVR